MHNHHNFISTMLAMSMISFFGRYYIDINQKMCMLSSTPIYVKFGGINGRKADPVWYPLLNTDYANVSRTGTNGVADATSNYGWSMGAHEWGTPVAVSSKVHPNDVSNGGTGHTGYIGTNNKSNSIDFVFNQSMDFRITAYDTTMDDPNTAPPATVGTWDTFLTWSAASGTFKDNSVIDTLQWSTTNYTLDTLEISPVIGGWGPASVGYSDYKTLNLASNLLYVWNPADTLLASGDGVSYTVDFTNPNVATAADWDASPGNGDLYIGGSSNIYVKFTESMSGCNPATITNATTHTPTWVTTNMDGYHNNDTLKLDPSGSWGFYSAPPTYINKLDISLSCKDLAGNTFTGSQTYTQDGSAPTRTISPGAGYLTNTSQAITITFNEQMDITATNGTVSPNGAGYTLTWNSPTNTVLTLAPSPAWNPGTFGFDLTCYDMSGNGVNAAASYTVDTIAPTFVSKNPNSNDYDFIIYQNIVVTFNETIASANVTSCNDGFGFPASWTPSGNSVTLTPPSGSYGYFLGPSGIGSVLQINLTVTDGAGNSSAHTITYTIVASVIP